MRTWEGPAARDQAPEFETAVNAWAWLSGGTEQAQRFLSFSEEQDQRLKNASQSMVMLVELAQLTDDPLLSLFLEAMRQRGYFAKQGGAVHLVFLDEQAATHEEAKDRTDQVLAGVNRAHQGATQLSPALASAVLAGQLAEAETLARAMRQAKFPAPTAVLVAAETFAPSSPPAFARVLNEAWPVEPRGQARGTFPFARGAESRGEPPANAGARRGTEERHADMIVVPITTDSGLGAQGSGSSPSQVVVMTPALRAALDIAAAEPAKRAEVAATMQEAYGVPVAKSDNPLVPFLPMPQVVAVTEELNTRLRTFRLTARSQ